MALRDKTSSMGRGISKSIGRSAGAVALLRTGQTQVAIASRLGVSRTLVAMVMSGQRGASAALRASAHRAYGVPLEAWDLPAGAEPRAPTRPRATTPASPATPAPPSDGTLTARVAELQRHVDELLAEARDPAATPLERGRLLASVATTIATIGKLTGESLVISERKILSLPGWRRVEEALVAALTPYPDALHAAGLALTRLGEAA